MRICFPSGDPRHAPSPSRKHVLLPVVRHQDQFGLGAVCSGGLGGSSLVAGRRAGAAFARGVVDGVWRMAGRGRRQGRHLLPLVAADGAERNPGKRLHGGVSLGAGTVQECPETPVELQTKVKASGQNTKTNARTFISVFSELGNGDVRIVHVCTRRRRRWS